jgi:glutamate-1-semialdehyde aminotransferase
VRRFSHHGHSDSFDSGRSGAKTSVCLIVLRLPETAKDTSLAKFNDLGKCKDLNEANKTKLAL